MKRRQLSHSTISEIVQLPRVKESELLCVLHSFFKYATNPLSRRARRFGDEKSGNFLDVRFKTDGTIAEFNGKLDGFHEKALADHVSLTLIGNQKEVVGQSVCFSQHDAVRGFYRYKDIFQLLPIAAEAPHAPMIAADHPFVVQFRYSSCSDRTINGYRRTEQTVKITRVLNTLCQSAISCSPRYVQHFWGIYPDKEFRCCLTQEGYGYPSFTPELEELSDTGGTPAIKLFPASEYYSIDFFSGGYDLTLPSSIEQYLDKVFSLKQEHAKQFQIASTWFSQIKGLWPSSSSSALIAVVSAIEALLDKESEPCKECRQPKFEVTKKFKAFLKEHVPEIEKFPEEFKAIYTMRSDLSHGNRLLVADLEYWNYFGTPLQQWQAEFLRNTHHITATALRNWALAR